MLELLALCAIVYGPLASDDLQALAPEIFNQQSIMVDAVQSDEVARFIITVGEQTCIFSHQRLREVFLEEIYQNEERDRLHRRLVAYGNDWWSKRTQPLSDYLRQFWLLHCAELGEWDLIREVVSAILPTADGGDLRNRGRSPATSQRGATAATWATWRGCGGGQRRRVIWA